MQKPGRRTAGRLWAITSFFNPCRQLRRLQTFRIFRERLRAPLVVVELGYDDTFELEAADAEVLVRVRGSDVLWQKERLLNIALGYLPTDCDRVAWVDADVVFERDDWQELALAALEECPLVQLFERRHDLPRDTLPEELTSLNQCRSFVGLGVKLMGGHATAEDFVAGAHLATGRTTGLAWGARRELLDKHGFYDACIVGSGDRAIVCAAAGRFNCLIESLHMSHGRSRHYLRWAKPFYESVLGSIGHSDGDVFHLWHGPLANRRADVRHLEFERFHFDPDNDIAITDSGCYRWDSDKIEMHAHVLKYFQTRADDHPSSCDREGE